MGDSAGVVLGASSGSKSKLPWLDYVSFAGGGGSGQGTVPLRNTFTEINKLGTIISTCPYVILPIGEPGRNELAQLNAQNSSSDILAKSIEQDQNSAKLTIRFTEGTRTNDKGNMHVKRTMNSINGLPDAIRAAADKPVLALGSQSHSQTVAGD